MKKLNDSEQKALNTIAAALGVPVEWPYNVISLETAKKDKTGRVVVTWDPAILNDTTKAAGIIQFMPDTARALGYKDQYDLLQKHPTIESQLLGPVLKYFKQFAPFPSEQSFYLSVFYPAYRYKSIDTTFSPLIQQQNPGIKTVGDYVAAVRRFGNIARGIPAAAAPIAGIILLIGLVGFLINRYLNFKG